jgi:capsule polysaccharide modification protein KpsS
MPYYKLIIREFIVITLQNFLIHEPDGKWCIILMHFFTTKILAFQKDHVDKWPKYRYNCMTRIAYFSSLRPPIKRGLNSPMAIDSGTGF